MTRIFDSVTIRKFGLVALRNFEWVGFMYKCRIYDNTVFFNYIGSFRSYGWIHYSIIIES